MRALRAETGMGRIALGEFEHQVLLTILRLGGESYSVPIVGAHADVDAGRACVAPWGRCD